MVVPEISVDQNIRRSGIGTDYNALSNEFVRWLKWTFLESLPERWHIADKFLLGFEISQWSCDWSTIVRSYHRIEKQKQTDTMRYRIGIFYSVFDSDLWIHSHISRDENLRELNSIDSPRCNYGITDPMRSNCNRCRQRMPRNSIVIIAPQRTIDMEMCVRCLRAERVSEKQRFPTSSSDGEYPRMLDYRTYTVVLRADDGRFRPRCPIYSHFPAIITLRHSETETYRQYRKDYFQLIKIHKSPD